MPRVSQPPPRYWFAAKRHGWGWGLPCSWQGWAVLIAALLIIAAAQVIWDRGVASLVAVPVLAGLTATAVAKGERPRWRWGGR